MILLLVFGPLACVGCSDTSEKKASLSEPITVTERVGKGRVIQEAPSDPGKEPYIQGSKQKQDLEDTQPAIEKVGNFLTPTEYFSIPSRHFSEAICAVSLPQDYNNDPTRKYPLVVAFGGAGECMRSPRQGALAWVHYYRADEAANALSSQNLKSSDFRGLVNKDQLEKFNRSLQTSPYKGVVLVCPYSPVLGMQPGLEFPEYEKYVMDELIPALCKHYRIDPSGIGVDGVSMGGARSMYYGFKYPEVFKRIGSVQAAVGPFMETYRLLINSNHDQISKCSIQIVSSDGDIFLKSVDAFSSMLNSLRLPHSLLILTGPHDYIFNQGPGSLALLAFHGLPTPKTPQGPVR